MKDLSTELKATFSEPGRLNKTNLSAQCLKEYLSTTVHSCPARSLQSQKTLVSRRTEKHSTACVFFTTPRLHHAHMQVTNSTSGGLELTL